MRIIIVDEDTVGAIGWYCARALRSLNHEVSIVDLEKRPRPAQRKKQSLRTLVARKAPFLVRRVVASRNRALVERTKRVKPDLVLVIKGRLVVSEALEAIRAFRDRPCVINWYPDAHLDLNCPEVLGAIKAYDHLFFKEKNLITHLKKIGLEKVHYLPHGTDPDVHRKLVVPKDLESRYRSDVAYAGHFYAYKAALLEWLSGFDLKIYGIGWGRLRRDHPLRRCWYGGPVLGEELTLAFNATKIVLNLHQHLECLGVHHRTFDAAACGAFQVVDDRPGIEEFFEPGRDLLVYRTPGELIEIIKAYLPRDREREEIGLRGIEKVRSRHTYVHRLKEILDIVGSS